ncbi:MAG: low molecular weight phosphotyrosine protein phosphatase [Rickettsiales bacterium]|nr:low molecular weight phosphotyrosine protein phosphatase [Rickettsiales bacterium]
MKILFVCTGNICRSPTAQAIARHKAKILHVENKLTFASAGIKVFYHQERPDSRVVKIGKERGVSFDNIFATQIENKDFKEYDLILAMTKDHRSHLLAMAEPQYHIKIKLLLEFCKVQNSWHDELIDPYYGSHSDITEVYNMIEKAVENLFRILGPDKW